MATGQRLTLVVLVEVPADGVRALQEYEALVLPLLAAHDGRLERRLRDGTGQVEVHVLSFGSREAYAAYLADEQRREHRPLLHGVDVQQRVLEVHEVQ